MSAEGVYAKIKKRTYLRLYQSSMLMLFVEIVHGY